MVQIASKPSSLNSPENAVYDEYAPRIATWLTPVPSGWPTERQIEGVRDLEKDFGDKCRSLVQGTVADKPTVKHLMTADPGSLRVSSKPLEEALDLAPYAQPPSELAASPSSSDSPLSEDYPKSMRSAMDLINTIASAIENNPTGYGILKKLFPDTTPCHF